MSSNLPNEIWFFIVKKLKLIDMFCFSIVSKRFYQICNESKTYRKKMRISKHIIGYDSFYFYVFDGIIKFISKDVKESSEKVIVGKKFVFSVVDINMSKTAYERLPFKNFNHLFYRHRGSKSPAIDKYCTRFYLEEIDQSSYVDQTFVAKKTDLASTNVLNLMEQVSAGSFDLTLYYAVGDFLSHDPKSENLVRPSWKLLIIRLDFILFMWKFYSEFTLRSSMKSETSLFTIISLRKKIRSEYIQKKKRHVVFSLIKLYCLHGRRLFQYLNLTLVDAAFEYMFLTYRPKVEHFKIMNHHYHESLL